MSFRCVECQLLKHCEQFYGPNGLTCDICIVEVQKAGAPHFIIYDVSVAAPSAAGRWTIIDGSPAWIATIQQPPDDLPF